MFLALAAAALCEEGETLEGLGFRPGALDGLAAPHSVSRMARACGMGEAEYERVRGAMAQVEGMWTELEPVAGAMELVAGAGARVMYVARRFGTARRRGVSSVWGDALVQTVAWLRRWFGVKYPVVEVEEDGWGESRVGGVWG